MPLLSIVIANYNYGRFLGEAIQSVLSQSCRDFELIIIDGGSADDSAAVIKKFAKGLPAGIRRDDPSIVHLHLSPSPITYWVSEKDGGQSDAFNKGFAKARGRFLTWLNADDVMLDGAIEMLRRASEQWPGQEWFAAGSVHFGLEGRVVRCARTRRFSEYEARHGMITVYSPSSFFSRRIYELVGGMDEFFKYSMDTHLWGRFYVQEHARFSVLPGYIFGFRYHPLSKTACGYFESIKTPEQKAVDDAQGAAERLRIKKLFPSHEPMNNLLRLLHLDWSAKIRSVIDTMRYRGKRIADCQFNA